MVSLLYKVCNLLCKIYITLRSLIRLKNDFLYNRENTCAISHSLKET